MIILLLNLLGMHCDICCHYPDANINEMQWSRVQMIQTFADAVPHGPCSCSSRCYQLSGLRVGVDNTTRVESQVVSELAGLLGRVGWC